MVDGATVTILVVDDDEAKRYSVSKILQKAGFVTLEAGDGGRRLAARRRPA